MRLNGKQRVFYKKSPASRIIVKSALLVGGIQFDVIKLKKWERINRNRAHVRCFSMGLNRAWLGPNEGQLGCEQTGVAQLAC